LAILLELSTKKSAPFISKTKPIIIKIIDIKIDIFSPSLVKYKTYMYYTTNKSFYTKQLYTIYMNFTSNI
jgi:hypothetical protein